MFSSIAKRQLSVVRNRAVATPKLLPGFVTGRSLAQIASTAVAETHLSDNVALHLPVAAQGPERDEFWRRIPIWQDVSANEFLSYRWSVSFSILINIQDGLVLVANYAPSIRLPTRFKAAPSSSSS